LFKKSDSHKDKLFMYLTRNGKLISLDFSDAYQINSFNYLDRLLKAKKIDYSFDFSQ